jgi:glycosyltransferase involved in cell wall biosynthesis
MKAPRPIRILHLRSSPFFGSPEKMILSRIKCLPMYDLKYAIGIFDEQLHAENDFHRMSRALNVSTLLLDTAMKRFTRNVTRFNRYVRDKGIHLVCAHDFKSNFYAFFIRMMTGIPVISVFHGRTMKDLKIRIYYLLDALIMSQMDTVICVSESQRNSLLRFLPSRKIQVIPNAVDIEEILRLSGEAATGVPPLYQKQKWIVFVGRLSREKGLIHLIRAFSRLTLIHGQVALLIIGDGPDREKLESFVNSLQLNLSVYFLGFKSNVYPYIRQAEFLVLPSLTEGMPVVILEAFALRKPVVATRVGGIPEVVRNDKEGMLVGARNESELGNAIARLIQRTDTTKQMGENAFRRVRQEHSFDVQTKRYHAIYRKILA